MAENEGEVPCFELFPTKQMTEKQAGLLKFGSLKIKEKRMHLTGCELIELCW